jgi:hypothetical protein
LVLFGFLGQKPVQTSLARFGLVFLVLARFSGFSDFGSVFSGFGSVFLVWLGFFSLTRFWLGFFPVLVPVRFGFFRSGSVFSGFFLFWFRFGLFFWFFTYKTETEPNRTG